MRENLIFYFPSIEGGGVEKNFFLLLKYLSKNVEKIHVITANRKKYFQKIIYICPKSNHWEKSSRTTKKFNLHFSFN